MIPTQSGKGEGDSIETRAAMKCIDSRAPAPVPVLAVSN